MPSRKQRRRREKLQRHEYEYVLETEEGEEIPVKSPRPRRAGEDGTRQKELVDRRGRPVPKPTLQRVLKRVAIFAPLLFVVVLLTRPQGEPIAASVARVTFLIAIFIPFSYLVDVLVYRALVRRHQRQS